MEERNEEYERLKRYREERKRQKLLEKTQQEQDGDSHQQRVEAARHAMENSRSWNEIQHEEEQKRKDRIESRKRELANSMYPTQSMQESVERWQHRNHTPPKETGPKFIAQDPKAVISIRIQQHSL